MRMLCLSAILATTLAVGLAAPAQAVPTSDQICAEIAAAPSTDTIIKMVIREVNNGTDPDDLGRSLVTSALYTCPQYGDLIRQSAQIMTNPAPYITGA